MRCSTFLPPIIPSAVCTASGTPSWSGSIDHSSQRTRYRFLCLHVLLKTLFPPLYKISGHDPQGVDKWTPKGGGSCKAGGAVHLCVVIMFVFTVLRSPFLSTSADPILITERPHHVSQRGSNPWQTVIFKHVTLRRAS